jgi:rhodanese-related sulfurtransferase
MNRAPRHSAPGPARDRPLGGPRSIREGVSIVIAGALLGLVGNAISPRGIPFVGDFSRGAALANRTAEEIAELPGETDATQVKADLGLAGVLVLDARDSEGYAEGHIPGALNLPVDDFDSHYQTLMERIEESALTIVYCDGGDCELSHDLAVMLRDLGHGPLQLFPGGYEEWIEAGYAVTVGSDP